jgi:DNA-binding NarL/FixJ family response regulator
MKYKTSYNFRFRTASGNYKLYNHQALVLTVDENGNFIKSLNIHTEISHLASKNNYLLSLIGLSGEPSFLRMQVLGYDDLTPLNSVGNVFSRRELDIIRLMAEGMDTREIAEKLHISMDTVKTHRKNINRKSGCRNSNELVAKSLSEGWV